MTIDASTHIEQKYLFPAGKEELILDWLEASLTEVAPIKKVDIHFNRQGALL